MPAQTVCGRVVAGPCCNALINIQHYILITHCVYLVLGQVLHTSPAQPAPARVLRMFLVPVSLGPHKNLGVHYDRQSHMFLADQGHHSPMAHILQHLQEILKQLANNQAVHLLVLHHKFPKSSVATVSS